MRDRQKEILELLEKSGASLYALLTRLTLRQDVAEELMQELFIKLTNTKGLYKIQNWSAYAHRAAINLAFDWRRKQNRTCLSLDNVHEAASNDCSPLSKLIHAEELQEILEAIGQLNRKSRQALIMRYIQQQPYDDIAEQMGKTAHQVRALCYKAINRLRDTLGSDRKEACDVQNR